MSTAGERLRALPQQRNDIFGCEAREKLTHPDCVEPCRERPFVIEKIRFLAEDAVGNAFASSAGQGLLYLRRSVEHGDSQIAALAGAQYGKLSGVAAHVEQAPHRPGKNQRYRVRKRAAGIVVVEFEPTRALGFLQ